MSAKTIEIERAVIDFYREEIRQRYQLDRMRQVAEFGKIPDEMLEAIRNFILERIYPPYEKRNEIEPCLEQLGLLLYSPLRVGLLLRSNAVSVLRLGAHLPAVISAAVASVNALRETGQLEKCMVEKARKLKLNPADAANRPTMLQVIAGVPEETVRNVISDVVRLFEALSNVNMLVGVMRVLQKCSETMEAHHDTYSEAERQGMKLALETLREGHALCKRLKAEDFRRIVKGISDIESAWYDSVRTEPDKAGTAAKN